MSGSIADQITQKEASSIGMSNQNRFGMWLFLTMEMLFFGGFFMLFAMSFHEHAADFNIASHHLNRTIAITNTALLLTSSFCMAIAVQFRKQKPESAAPSARPWLWATAIFGAVFLVLKFHEYQLDAQEGILPFVHYAPNFMAAPAVYQFFSLYFFVTLIHFVHLTIGCCWVTGLALRSSDEKQGGSHGDPVEIAGLYWHFVDVIWIFLLPTLYLLQ